MGFAFPKELRNALVETVSQAAVLEEEAQERLRPDDETRLSG